MDKQKKTALMANLVGIGAIAIIGVYFVHDLTYTEEAKPCSSHFAPPVSLNLQQNNGSLISPVTLQARSQSQDWGLLENLKIETTNDDPSLAVFDFALKHGDASSTAHKLGGAAFPWRPSQLSTAQSVCFSYNVRVPDKFEYGDGGILPGVASDGVWREAQDDDEGAEAFERKLRVHPVWNENGQMDVLIYDPTDTRHNERLILSGKAALPPGVWNRVEMELVLNSADKPDGKVRMWINGDLAVNKENVEVAKEDKTRFQTAFYHVSRGTPAAGRGHADFQDASVELTPLELSWK